MELNYAGIGSRDCPDWVLELIIKTASWLAKKGVVLNSGRADGCDLAFERGCDLSNGKKRIFLPWRKFNNSNSNLYLSEDFLKYNIKSVDIAKKYHPCFDKLSDGGKRLQTRNSYQVLGENLETPVDFVICYTKNGSGSGGTGQALRIAKAYNIPIFDFGMYKDINQCRVEFNKFIAKFIK